MTRIVVLGGTGYFGRAAVDLLRAAGASPLVASRRGPDLAVDVEDPASIRAAFRPSDVALDVVGPFQDRTTALVEAGIDVGFHVVDVSDSLDHAERVHALASRARSAQIAVLTSCSSLSAVTAALVSLSGIASPVRASAFLRPATRHTANAATGASALRSLGRPIRVLRDGAIVQDVGWRASRAMDLPPPVGRVRGRLVESADSVNLPRVWPSLRTVDFWVDPNVPGLRTLLGAAARSPALRRLVEWTSRPGLALARLLGGSTGILGLEVDGEGKAARFALVGGDRTQLTAVGPAVQAARALAEGRFPHRGVVPHDRHADPEALVASLRKVGIECLRET